MFPFTVIRRAFAANLHKVSATSGEQAALEAAGIHEPTIQHYLAWRRSMVVMVVLATILSASLTTFRALTGSDDQSPFSAVTERLLEEAGESPLAVRESDDSDESDRSRDAEPRTDKAILKNAHVQAAAALAGLQAEAEQRTNAFGRFADGVHLASLYATPLAALAALYWWPRFKLTFRILAVGWAFAFFAPMLVALCPWSWWGYVEPNVRPGKYGPQHYRAMAEGILEGAEYLIALLPTVLSLIPGVQRACLRVKTLLPESILPGWFLVSAGPLYALFLLVIFVVVNQIASNPLFLAGMSLLVVAPLVYVVRADVFTTPLTSDEAYRGMRRAQRIVSGMTAMGCIVLVIYLTTCDVLGIHLVGLDERTSLLRPIDLVDYSLEFVGRLLFMTVLGADLFMRMNLAAWKSLGQFMRSGKAEDYDRTMHAMQQIATGWDR